ncbi:S24 family peptidase [Chryseobacterium sp. G0240]|uniref:S24 family peptidase n=1 Tax=Chryseobacterium sp. G0240 TaxID=2487066 RepID=UPI000F4573A8|nr:S24 family peptidase [Chryseobacterium sp. G0240]ROH98317.1 S24 family peptidase [Chryseobacterium sp. G0240]
MDGGFIRKKIELSGFQLVDVAKKLEITPQDLQSKLKSKDVKVSFLVNVAKAINKSVYYFFESKNENILTIENSKENGKENSNKPKVNKTLPSEIEELSINSTQPQYDKVMQKLKFAEGFNLSDNGAPFYELPVSAGRVHELINMQERPSGYISMPGVNCDAYFPITGASFDPYIRAGDVIGINFIDRWENLDPDCIYLIITYDQRMIKRLMNHPTDSTLLICMSPNYKEFNIDKFTIRYIHKVTFYGRPV